MKKNNTTKNPQTSVEAAQTTKTVEAPVEAPVEAAQSIADMIGSISAKTDGTRGIPCAAALSQFGQTTALDVYNAAIKDPEAADLIKKVLEDHSYTATIELIQKYRSAGDLKNLTAFMSNLKEDELGRLLESKRSDRSKVVKAGLKGPNFLKFLSDVIGEMVVREWSGKIYAATRESTIDTDELAKDQTALNKKIRSLQSKVSVLKRTGRFASSDWEGWKEIEKTQELIKELQAHRISSGTSSKVAVKDERAQAMTYLNGLSAEQLKALMDQLQSKTEVTEG